MQKTYYFMIMFLVSIMQSSCSDNKANTSDNKTTSTDEIPKTVAKNEEEKPLITNEEAKTLIIKDLGLPVTYSQDLPKTPSVISADVLDALQKAGLVKGPGMISTDRPVEIEVTERGKSSFLSVTPDAYRFKTNTITFGSISGISINKQDQTAVIRFTLMPTDVTPAGIALSHQSMGFSGKNYIPYDLNNPIKAELVYKRFDTGWQLQSNSNKTGVELLNSILKGDK